MRKKHWPGGFLLAFVLVPLLLGSNSADECVVGQADPFRLEKQEQCELLCLSCDEDDFCLAISRLCCKVYGGHLHSDCGCRTEL